MPDWQWLTTGGAAFVALILFALAVRAILRKRRRPATPAADGKRTGRGRDATLNAAAWLVAAVSGFLAAQGQVDFAEWAGVDDWRKYLVPAILEPAVVVLMLLANRREQRLADNQPARSPRPLLALAAGLGGFAVYTNAMHAGRGGLVFGAASAIALVLWWVKLRDAANPGAAELDDSKRAESQRVSRRTARYRWLRWAMFPRQTHRAWRLSLGYSIADAEQGLDLARLWQRTVAERRDTLDARWLGPRWWRARRAGDEAVRLAILAERDRPTRQQSPTPPPPPPVPPQVRVNRPAPPPPPNPGKWWADLVDPTAGRAEQMREILYHAIRLGREVPRASELDRMVTPPAQDFAKKSYRVWRAEAEQRVAADLAEQRNGHNLAGAR